MGANREILMKFITQQNEKVKQDVSMQGYKDDSPYRNNPSNTIYGTPQGTPITMQGVSTPLIGMDEFGNQQYMQPGQEYQFPGSRVVETPMARYGGLLNKTIKCNNCGWSWKAADGGNDVGTCHKCGQQVSIYAQEGGSTYKFAPVPITHGDYYDVNLTKALRGGTWFGNADEMSVSNKYQNAGTVKPVYVESKNDPRYRAYQDSLLLHNFYKNPIGKGGVNYWEIGDKRRMVDRKTAEIINKREKTYPFYEINHEKFNKNKTQPNPSTNLKDFYTVKSKISPQYRKSLEQDKQDIINDTGDYWGTDYNAFKKKPLYTDGTRRFKFDEQSDSYGEVIYDPITGMVRYDVIMLPSENNNYKRYTKTTGMSSEKMKPIGVTYNAYSKPNYYDGIAITTNGVKQKIDNVTENLEINPYYKNPTTPVIVNKNKYNSNDSRLLDLQKRLENTLLKPQQQVIVKPTTSKQSTKPTPGTKKEIFSKDTPQVEGIELQPIGIQIPHDFNIEAPLPQIRQQVRIPKYYDIEDYTQGSANYIGNQTNYTTSDLNTLSQQSHNNTRKITPRYQIGGTTGNNEKSSNTNEAARRVVQLAEERIKNNNYISIPKDIEDIARSRGESAFSCIGGVCTVLKEAGVMNKVDWSNTNFSKNAKEYGFTANQGWGVKGIENLEPGDVLQYNNKKNEQGNFYPGHSQIYLGKDAKGNRRFFDNFWKTEKTYYEDEVKNLLDRARKKTESSATIYKVNPYNDSNPLGLTPEEQKNYDDKQEFIKKESTSKSSYKWSISPTAKDYNENTKRVMDKFLDFANDNDKINDLVKKTGKSKEEIQDSLLNVFGELGVENNWTTSKGRGLGSRLENIGESVLTSLGGGKSLSVGPGQIKFSELSEDLKEQFNIQSPNDLYDVEKVLPLMTAMDIRDKQVLENWGESNKLSKKLFGFTRPETVNPDGTTTGGFTADQLYSETDGSRLNNGVGRYSPYLRTQYGSIASGNTYEGNDDWVPFNEGTVPNFTEGRFTKSGEDEMRVKYERDPGSYPYKVEQNWRENLNRFMTPNADGAMELNEVVIPNKQIGGLTKYQTKGQVRDERIDALQTRDNVPAVNDYNLQIKREVLKTKLAEQRQKNAQKKFESLPKKEQEKILYDQYNAQHGSISKYTPESTLSGVANIGLAPFSALKAKMETGHVPDNLVKGLIQNPDQINPYDAAYLGSLVYAAAPVVSAGAAAAAPYATMIGNSLAADALGVAGLNAGNALTAGFATHGAMNIAPDLQSWYNKPTTEGFGKIAWDALEMLPAVGPAAKTIGEGFNAISRTLGREKNLALSVENAIPNVAESVVPAPWQMQELPGLHLQSTMENGALSKIVEPKTGLINTEQALAIIGKESGGADKVAIIKQGLGENIPKKMDYNDFRKVVQDQIIPLETNLVEHSSNYGLGSIGYSSPKRSSFDSAINNTNQEIEKITNKIKQKEAEGFAGNLDSGVPMFEQRANYDSEIADLYQMLGESKTQLAKNLEGLKNIPLENKTLVFSNKSKFGKGSSAHNNPDETLGHAHYLIDAETPDVLTVTQIQSDAFQGTHRIMPKSFDPERAKYAAGRMAEIQEKNKSVLNKMITEGVDETGRPVVDYEIKQMQEIVDAQELQNTLQKGHVENFTQKSLLDKNHQERYLQEIVNHAAQRGNINKVRVPTSETAANVQGYYKQPFNIGDISDESLITYNNLKKQKENAEQLLAIGKNITEKEKAELLSVINNPELKKIEMLQKYSLEHQTILKKYSEQPKLIKKLFGQDAKIVTDSKGNTWYEFDIPESFKQGKGQIKAFKQGGDLLSPYNDMTEFDRMVTQELGGMLYANKDAGLPHEQSMDKYLSAQNNLLDFMKRVKVVGGPVPFDEYYRENIINPRNKS